MRLDIWWAKGVLRSNIIEQNSDKRKQMMGTATLHSSVMVSLMGKVLAISRDSLTTDWRRRSNQLG